MNPQSIKIAVIGLGYVGLPLALEFSKKYKVLGFDISESRIKELSAGVDKTQKIQTSGCNFLVSRKTLMHAMFL
jgi:UDP-N-acetyl-D-galactosamine dehydrogenase